jgi:hypothetical protein
LVTIISHGNYGNRLQNYAMHRIITDLGFDCTTILNSPRSTEEAASRKAQNAKRSPVRALMPRTTLPSLRRLFMGAEEREARDARRLQGQKDLRGRAFTSAHIRESDFTIYRDTPTEDLDAMHDLFVVGSDQVWNPNFRRLAEVDFLTFASKEKRIAFSASMGVSDIAEEHRAFYRKRLSEFAHISVREEAAAEEVRTLTGRTVPVTVDPTLMLPAEDWSALAKRHPAQPAGGYVATYFLGPRPEACQRLIDRCTARLGLKVVHLNDTAAPDIFTADPAEFLGVLQEARFVCTDSFHGAIFSTLFGTPFVSFERVSKTPSMSLRLDTLLAILRLEHRRFRDEPGDAELDKLLEPDFDHVAKILDRKAAQARAYLMRASGQGDQAAETKELALPQG